MLNINTLKYSELFDLRLKRKEKDMPWHVMSKDGTREFCKRIGADSVEILAIFNNLQSVNFSNLPEQFVLKPALGHSDSGVMLLTKKDNGQYFEGFSQTELTFDEIIHGQKLAIEKFSLDPNGKYIIEEYIPDIYGDIIPHDFKFFIFQGEIAIIMEVNRNKNEIQKHYFFDPDFSPIGKGKVLGLADYFKLVRLPRPDFAEKLINLAKRVSIALPTPFARIDLYFDGNKAKVGEITLTPYYGYPYKWTLSQDIIMGRMWLDAIERLDRTLEDSFEWGDN